MEIIDHYLYTKEHEWVDIDGKVGTVGITEYAQSALGDITFVELPGSADEVEQFERLTSLESVKSASDIFSPISGKVVEVNDKLTQDPGLINRDCYEKGWIAKIKISDEDETSNLLTADEYSNYLESLDRNDGGESADE
ncbi:MAG: glycine cleavage system protein GcvH [Candidatus Omnitrophica bacterium]|nr:glycine cleavage system protein GcvH [Candidatus Omnitrophota bacterium]